MRHVATVAWMISGMALCAWIQPMAAEEANSHIKVGETESGVKVIYENRINFKLEWKAPADVKDTTYVKIWASTKPKSDSVGWGMLYDTAKKSPWNPLQYNEKRIPFLDVTVPTDPQFQGRFYLIFDLKDAANNYAFKPHQRNTPPTSVPKQPTETAEEYYLECGVPNANPDAILVLDREKPKIKIKQPGKDSLFNLGEMISVAWAADDHSKLFPNGNLDTQPVELFIQAQGSTEAPKPVKAGMSAEASTQVAIPDTCGPGTYNLIFRVWDKAGNENEEAVAITLTRPEQPRAGAVTLNLDPKTGRPGAVRTAATLGGVEVNFLSPKPDEALDAKNAIGASWSTKNAPADMKINLEYSWDDGDHWKTVARDLMGDGQYSFNQLYGGKGQRQRLRLVSQYTAPVEVSFIVAGAERLGDPGDMGQPTAPGTPNAPVSKDVTAVPYSPEGNTALAEALNLTENERVALTSHQAGLVYFYQGKYEEAQRYFETAVQKDLKNSLYANDLGAVYYAQLNYKGAADLYLKAINLDLQRKLFNPMAHYNLALCYIAQKQYQPAMLSLVRIREWADEAQFAAKRNKQDSVVRAKVALSELYLMSEDYESAKALWNELANPPYPGEIRDKAQAYLKQFQYTNNKRQPSTPSSLPTGATPTQGVTPGAAPAPSGATIRTSDF